MFKLVKSFFKKGFSSGSSNTDEALLEQRQAKEHKQKDPFKKPTTEQQHVGATTFHLRGSAPLDEEIIL